MNLWVVCTVQCGPEVAGRIQNMSMTVKDYLVHFLSASSSDSCAVPLSQKELCLRRGPVPQVQIFHVFYNRYCFYVYVCMYLMWLTYVYGWVCVHFCRV